MATAHAWAPARECEHDAAALHDLYQQDQLICHTIAPALIAKRHKHIKDKSSLLCCTLLFGGGGLNHKTKGPMRNSVARFGADARDTVFGTLHALGQVAATNRSLEAAKPAGQRGEPFVFFSNSDIDDVCQASGGPPPRDYLQCTWQRSEPCSLQRPVTMNFREFCETLEDKENQGPNQGDWNEMRAVLNDDNMVGLVYVADGAHDPRTHVQVAQQLSASFDHAFEMVVFQTNEPGGVRGDLLVAAAEDVGAAAAGGAGGGAGGGGGGGAGGSSISKATARLVTFHEYLDQVRSRLAA